MAPFKSAELFDRFRELIKQQGAGLTTKIAAVYQFNLTNAAGEQKSWVIDLKNGSGSVSEGTAKADTTLSMKDDDYVAMANGKLDSQMAFMQGKLKIAGSIAHAMKLGGLLAEAQKIQASAPAAAPAAGGDFKSARVFDLIRQKVGQQGAQLVQKIGAVYQFNLTNNAGDKRSWVIDLKNGNGSVTEGEGKADTTLTLKDDDFVAMNSGKLDSQMAFMTGKLKIGGNMAHALKLNMLLSQVANM